MLFNNTFGFCNSLQFTATHVSFSSAIYSDKMSFVLFWRCIVCSGRSSSLPPTIKLRSPSFTVTPFSSLSSSSSSHFTPPLNIISDLLTKECGFSSSQVTTVMRRRPYLLRTKSDHTAREVIHLLKDSGFSEKKLQSTIIRDPGILSLRADSQLKPKMEFLKKMGLATQDIVHIVSISPRLLSLSLDNCLAPRILHLETLFGSRVNLCKALRIGPELLMGDFEKQVEPKVEYLKDRIGILKDSAAFARSLNAVISLSLETLEAKTKHMASLGLGEEEIGQILKGYTHAFRISTKKMTANVDFLIGTAGFDIKIVASYPEILGLSVEKRLRPRYELFKSLSTSPHVKDLPCLARFFRLSEQKFRKYIDQIQY